LTDVDHLMILRLFCYEVMHKLPKVEKLTNGRMKEIRGLHTVRNDFAQKSGWFRETKLRPDRA